MCSKKITPDAALQGYSLKILKQLLCKTKHGNLTQTDLEKLQMGVNIKLKPAMKIAKTVPNGIFFGHAIAGGLSIPHIWDETNVET